MGVANQDQPRPQQNKAKEDEDFDFVPPSYKNYEEYRRDAKRGHPRTNFIVSDQEEIEKVKQDIRNLNLLMA